MILLRILSILAGGLVLVLPPLFLFSGSRGPTYFDGLTVFGVIAGLVLVSSSFFFVGFAGDRMRKSARLRLLGAALLAVPFVGAAAILWRSADPLQLVAGGVLFCFTAVLFVAFVLQVQSERKHRPMRARETREPRLSAGRG